MSAKKAILVTGATRGIGLALANELARRGHKVYGAGRSWKGDEADLTFTPVKLDVNDDDSINAVIEKIVSENGRIDVLVNNAGISHSGSIEETPIEVARSMFETNYIGPVLLIRAVLPHMREKRSGLIANVGSAAGKIGVPFQAHYAASKFAVEGLSESLMHELSGFGIRVILIEPGDVKTDIWDISKSPVPENSPYTAALTRHLAVKDKEMGASAAPAEAVAKEIADAIESEGSKLRYPVPLGARLILTARKLLPDRLFLYAVARNYKIK